MTRYEEDIHRDIRKIRVALENLAVSVAKIADTLAESGKKEEPPQRISYEQLRDDNEIEVYGVDC